jgi:hypothetical protein
MSDAVAPKKVETAPKKIEAAKPAASKVDPAKPDAAKPDTSNADSSAKKAEPTAKSASQESISYFSSVSTPEYRSGWDQIFGAGEKSGQEILRNTNDRELPEKLTLMDADINVELRILLNDAFEILAKDNKIFLDIITKKAVLEYSIDCWIIKR